MKPILVHVQPRLSPDGARTDVRVSSGGGPAAGGLGGFRWQKAMMRRPRMSIDMLSPTLDGRVQVGRADLVINLSAIRDMKAKAFYWPGAPVTIYDASGLDLTTAPIEFTGYVRTSQYDDQTEHLTLNVEVLSQALEKPLLFNEFTGGSGLLGDPELKGTNKPAGFGSVKNVEPVWFDMTRNIGMIDGYGNTVSIDAMFEGGNDFGARVADYADYATLAARIDDKTVPPGRWATCVAQGLVGIGAPMVKPITVDAVFGSNRAGAFIRRIMETHCGIAVGSIDTAAFTALDAAVNRAVHYWTSSQRAAKDLIEAIAGSCNATPIVTFQGKYSITRVFGGANIATFDRQQPLASQRVIKWRSLDAEPPTWRMKMRAARPGVVLTQDQILYADDLIDRGIHSALTVYRQGNLVWNDAGAQFLYINAVPKAGEFPPIPPATANAYWQQTKPAPDAADLFYADGTSIEALRPASAGATRQEDGSNMISAPVTLINVTTINGAQRYVVPASTGRIAFRYHVGLAVANNSTAYWAGIAEIPCAPGERLYYRHAVYPEPGVGTDTTIAFMDFYGTNGALILSIDVPGTLMGGIPSGVFTEVSGSVTVPPNSAFVRPGVRRAVFTTGTFYVGEPHLGRQMPGATRLDDGANMIPSPVRLDYAAVINGADVEVTGADGRPANKYRARLRTVANSTVFWHRDVNIIACVPGERLFYSHVIYIDTNNTNVTQGLLEWYGAAGEPRGSSLVDGTAHSGNISNNSWVQKSGSIIVPAEVAFVRPAARRDVAGAGIHYVSEPFLGRNQQGAEVNTEITGPATLEAPATSAGVLVGASPYVTGQYKLMEAGVQITAGITWTTDNPAGQANTITGSGTATLNITGLTVDTVKVKLTATRLGKTPRYFDVDVRKNKSPPPTGGSAGGTSQSLTSGFSTAMSSAAQAISGELTINLGAAGTATLNTSLSNDPGADGNPGGTWNDRAQWYRWNGASFVAILSTFNFTVATEFYSAGYTDGEGYYSPPENYSEPGSVSNSQVYTGAANAVGERYKLYAWHVTGTNLTRSMSFAGTVSATGA